jgi:large subunit ribosomal protein L6
MSIEVPKGAKVSFSSDLFTVEGPKGKLTQSYDSCISFNQEGSLIRVVRSSEEKSVKAKHGLYRNLLNNMLIGVVQGFSRVLVINGVGYRGEVKGNVLTLNLGYSNQIEYMIPKGIQVAVENNTKISVAGISKEQVGQVASEIRSLRAPEPYKGKGIRYEDETIRRKVGKSGVKK